MKTRFRLSEKNTFLVFFFPQPQERFLLSSFPFSVTRVGA